MDRKGRKKLEWKQTLVVLLAMVTMAAMNSYIDWLNQAGPEGEEAVADAAAGGAAVALAAEAAGNHEGIIRFHVIANSDSEEDQDLKLKVRNHVLLKVQSQLMKLTKGEQAELIREYINDNMEEIEDLAREVIRKEGFDYDVKASLGVTWIPAKNYDGLFFPAGNYEALNIVIGEGEGQNWWCVIFPPLCLIDERPDGRGDIGDIGDMEGGSRVILKSKIVELLEKWQKD